MTRRVFITAAEVSGDMHAAQLARALKAIEPDIVIEGHGGPEMAAAGVVIHSETVSRAAMGFAAAARAVELSKVLRWTRDHFQKTPPDLLIGVDSPSMNFHFARVAKDLGVPVMQYVAPQLWAWREGRMKKLRRWVDQLACILPFEEKYFRDHGVNATFVGHPLFDQLPPQSHEPQRPPLTSGRPAMVGLLPGSRKSEAKQNFPRLMATAELIRQALPDVSFLVPTTAATHPVVEAMLASSPRCEATQQIDGERCVRLNGPAGAPLHYAREAFDDMVPRCDLCLTVSGTATLHVAALGAPMIVVYAARRWVWELVGRWMIKTRTFSLVNVLAAGPRGKRENHIVPEFVPWLGPVEPVAEQAIDLLRHPEKLVAQREALSRMLATLDEPGASDRAARLALRMIDAHRPAPLAHPAVAD